MAKPVTKERTIRRLYKELRKEKGRDSCTLPRCGPKDKRKLVLITPDGDVKLTLTKKGRIEAKLHTVDPQGIGLNPYKRRK